jgi:hypothetical protein
MLVQLARQRALHAILVIPLLLLLLLPHVATGAACAGDLDGDDKVTIDEIVTIVNAALLGCAGAGGAVVVGCPGDVNGDGMVTINEIILAIRSALDGCPVTPTPTASPTSTPPPPTATARPTETATSAPTVTATTTPTETVTTTPSATATTTQTTCPFTFADNMSSACVYSGTFNADPTCSVGLMAFLLGDGQFIIAELGTIPLLALDGTVTSATSATLQSYTVGTDPTPHPITGTMELQDGGGTLIISLDTPLPFSIGVPTCTIESYDGTFTEVFGG